MVEIRWHSSDRVGFVNPLTSRYVYTTATDNPTPYVPSSAPKPPTLSIGARAAIGVCAPLAFIGILIAVFAFWRVRRRRKQETREISQVGGNAVGMSNLPQQRPNQAPGQSNAQQIRRPLGEMEEQRPTHEIAEKSVLPHERHEMLEQRNPQEVTSSSIERYELDERAPRGLQDDQ